LEISSNWAPPPMSSAIQSIPTHVFCSHRFHHSIRTHRPSARSWREIRRPQSTLRPDAPLHSGARRYRIGADQNFRYWFKGEKKRRTFPPAISRILAIELNRYQMLAKPKATTKDTKLAIKGLGIGFNRIKTLPALPTVTNQRRLV